MEIFIYVELHFFIVLKSVSWMMKKYVALLLLVALSLDVFGIKAGSYDSSVFYPNGVKYSVYLSYNYSETGENYTYTSNTTINMRIALIAKDMSLNYVGWGFNLSFSMIQYENGQKTNEENRGIPVPPILIAVKKNTREIHPTDVLMDLLTGETTADNVSQIVGNLYTATPVEDIYIYNPFYIESNHKVGDKIIYGAVNKTANEEYTVEIEITDEKDLQFDFGTIKTLVLEVSLDDLNLPEDLFEENLGNITGEATLRVYYEKKTGWLVRAEVSGSLNGTSENKTVGGSIWGLVDLVDMGTIQLINYDYLSRILGLPPYSLVAGALVIVAIVVYSKFLRRSSL